MGVTTSTMQSHGGFATPVLESCRYCPRSRKRHQLRPSSSPNTHESTTADHHCLHICQTVCITTSCKPGSSMPWRLRLHVSPAWDLGSDAPKAPGQSGYALETPCLSLSGSDSRVPCALCVPGLLRMCSGHVGVGQPQYAGTHSCSSWRTM